MALTSALYGVGLYGNSLYGRIIVSQTLDIPIEALGYVATGSPNEIVVVPLPRGPNVFALGGIGPGT